MQHQRLMRSARKEPAKTPSSAFLQTVPDMQIDATPQASVEPRLGHDFGRIPLHAAPTGAFQARLAVSQPGDVYEQEADHVAGQVMGGSKPEPALGDERSEASPFLARKPSTASGGTAAATGASSLVHPALRSGGQSLDAETQSFMEPRFGQDFSKVRIHADERAAESARSFNALAYTVGQDIVFGEGQYAPGTSAGKRLLAHELTHTLQQRPTDASNQVAGTEPVQATPGPLVQRETDVAEPDSTDQSTSETSDQSTSETPKSVAEMTSTERLVKALGQAWIHLGPAIANAIKGMMSPEALAIALGLFIAGFLASQLTPIGWLVDLGIIAISGIFMAISLFKAIKHLINFFEARNATTPKELDQAGAEFADAVTEIGVDMLMLFVMHKLGKVTKDGGSGPSGGPPSASAVTPEGQLVPVAGTIPVEVEAATARGGALAASSMMMSASGGGGSSGSGEGSSGDKKPPLTNADKAQIDPAKFDKYSMDPNNPRNGGKWKAFVGVGYDVNSAEGRTQGAQDVIQQLRKELPNQPAIPEGMTQFGSRFEVDVPIRGPNGKEGTLVTVWQYDAGSDTPRLITNYLQVHK